MFEALIPAVSGSTERPSEMPPGEWGVFSVTLMQKLGERSILLGIRIAGSVRPVDLVWMFLCGIWQMLWYSQLEIFQWFSFGNFWLLPWKLSVVRGTKKILLSFYSSFYYFNSSLPVRCLAWKMINFPIPELQDLWEIWILALRPFWFTMDHRDDWWIANTG